MNEETEEMVYKLAEYSTEEKNSLMKKLHFFSWVGVLTFVVYMVLILLGFLKVVLQKISLYYVSVFLLDRCCTRDKDSIFLISKGGSIGCRVTGSCCGCDV
ncbi:hypothetical protein ACR6HW_06240 [Fusibacter sp. JL298sf-3]